MTRIAVIGMGAMGSAVGAVLLSKGAEVVTILDGRSSETRARAAAIGIRSVDLATVVEADIILSIVPPAEAPSVAHQVADAMTGSISPAHFVDCNAISPETMSAVAHAFGGNLGRVLDGCIIGGPPKVGHAGPRLYVSGGGINVVDTLNGHGLDARLLQSGVGAASALKMCYAGINKGLTGLATAMLLAAAERGADEALMAEMNESQGDLLAKLSKSIPDMYPKAYRWVAEMKEIADFLGPENPAAEIFVGMEGVYRQMAADRSNDSELATTLSRMIERKHSDKTAR
ncbi:NAD(P)-dependent oxidoreductase [Rhizobium cauense]|uniref:NAD(P)-dependent oxidoreductase n=1 Tax=Rhizobium cauense TaxID=1166683 RepID=UPI001C6E33AE|nr:NAD(P)-dependent oxidoreductase [Rhizobium cauense]MBW9113517.1 NAD(P)-dependent oxidoreductase [Rhizobium cauense]